MRDVRNDPKKISWIFWTMRFASYFMIILGFIIMFYLFATA